MRAVLMLKPGCVCLFLSIFSVAVYADEADPCAGLAGDGLTQCRANQQTRRQQERLEQMLQQQQERQNDLDKQQREVKQQLESMRAENESLRKQMERQAASAAARPAAMSSMDSSKNPDGSKNLDLQNWRAKNPWFGSDYPRTQFAMRYMKQLQQERPDLGGRELLDALSTKVDETFGAKH